MLTGICGSVIFFPLHFHHLMLAEPRRHQQRSPRNVTSSTGKPAPTTSQRSHLGHSLPETPQLAVSKTTPETRPHRRGPRASHGTCLDCCAGRHDAPRYSIDRDVPAITLAGIPRAGSTASLPSYVSKEGDLAEPLRIRSTASGSGGSTPGMTCLSWASGQWFLYGSAMRTLGVPGILGTNINPFLLDFATGLPGAGTYNLADGFVHAGVGSLRINFLVR